MKKMRNIILVLVALALILAIIMFNYSNNALVDERNLNSITIVNNSFSSIKNLVGQAKEVEDQEDMQDICDAFNSIKYKKIEESAIIPVDGGESYTFLFKYSTGETKKITYTDGPYLYIEEEYYQIYTEEFDDFWNLDYPIKEWHFNEDGSYDVNQ